MNSMLFEEELKTLVKVFSSGKNRLQVEGAE